MTYPSPAATRAAGQRGLTLIEALAVILILAVIAAILFPVFARSHTQSGPSCFGNMKQIGLAMLQYSQDNNEMFPTKQAQAGGRTISWRAELYPYVKSSQIYQCPTNPMAQTSDVERDGFMRSYAVNASTGGAKGIGGIFASNRQSANLMHINSPGSVIVLVESTAAFADFNPLIPGQFAQPTDKASIAGSLHMHNEWSNFLFADGHVKALQPLSTLGGSKEQPLNFWTMDNSPYAPVEAKTAQDTLAYAVSHNN